MERNRSPYRGKYCDGRGALNRSEHPQPAQHCNNSSVLCVTKSILFIAVSAFVLYAPIGEYDADNLLESTLCSYSMIKDFAVKLSCDSFKVLVFFIQKVMEFTKILFYLLMDLLYEVKMEIYSLLHKLDRTDICKVVCCEDMDLDCSLLIKNPTPIKKEDGEDKATEVPSIKRVPSCKCSIKHCRPQRKKTYTTL